MKPLAMDVYDSLCEEIDTLKKRIEAIEHFASQATLLINTLIEVRTPKRQGEAITMPDEVRKMFEVLSPGSTIRSE